MGITVRGLRGERMNKNKGIEENIDTLRVCNDKVKISDCWATLQFPMDSMTVEQRSTIYEAERLLKEAGIRFDTGCGCGFIDWELDWSLSGAILKKQEIRCMNCHKKNVPFIVVRLKRIYDGLIFDRVFCCEDCITEYTKDEFQIIGIIQK